MLQNRRTAVGFHFQNHIQTLLLDVFLLNKVLKWKNIVAGFFLKLSFLLLCFNYNKKKKITKKIDLNSCIQRMGKNPIYSYLNSEQVNDSLIFISEMTVLDLTKSFMFT